MIQNICFGTWRWSGIYIDDRDSGRNMVIVSAYLPDNGPTTTPEEMLWLVRYLIIIGAHANVSIAITPSLSACLNFFWLNLGSKPTLLTQHDKKSLMRQLSMSQPGKWSRIGQWWIHHYSSIIESLSFSWRGIQPRCPRSAQEKWIEEAIRTFLPYILSGVDEVYRYSFRIKEKILHPLLKIRSSSLTLGEIPSKW